MALIKCPECLTEVSDCAPTCPKCGFPVSDWVKQKEQKEKNEAAAAKEAVEYVKKEQARKEQEKKQLRQAEERNKKINALMPKIIIIAVICIIIGISIPIINEKIIIPRKKYQDAVALMESGDYNNAILAFQELDDEGKYIEKVQECFYLKGESFLSQGDYPSAILSYEKADDYKDSKTKLKQTKEKSEKEENDKTYEKAKKFLDNGDYGSAIPLFNALRSKGYQLPEDIENSLSIEHNYQDAINTSSQSLKAATESLTNLPSNYKNVDELIQETEDLLEYEGEYIASGDFWNAYDSSRGEDYSYDVEFEIKFSMDEKGVMARIIKAHALVHDKKRGQDYDTKDNSPIKGGTYPVMKNKNGDYYFVIDNSWYSDRNYEMLFENGNIKICNDDRTYYAKKK